MSKTNNFCWSCGQKNLSPLLCTNCGKISEPQPLADAFAFLGILQSFIINLEQLEQQYLTHSRLVHPDLSPFQSTREKLYATQITATLNEAYEILKHPVERGYHLLALHGIQLNRETATLDPQILMEILEDREALESTEDSLTLVSLIETTQSKRDALFQNINDDFEAQRFEQALARLTQYGYYEKFLQTAEQKSVQR